SGAAARHRCAFERRTACGGGNCADWFAKPQATFGGLVARTPRLAQRLALTGGQLFVGFPVVDMIAGHMSRIPRPAWLRYGIALVAVFVVVEVRYFLERVDRLPGPPLTMMLV